MLEQCKQEKRVQGDPSRDWADSLPPNRGEAQALGYISKQTQAAPKILHSFGNLSSLEHGKIPRFRPATPIQV